MDGEVVFSLIRAMKNSNRDLLMLTKIVELRPNSAMIRNSEHKWRFEQVVDLSLLRACLPCWLCRWSLVSLATQELCEDPETVIVMDLMDEGLSIKPQHREVTGARPRDPR